MKNMHTEVRVERVKGKELEDDVLKKNENFCEHIQV